MYSYGPPLMSKQKQDDQLEHTYSSYVKIQEVMNDREKWREKVRDICVGGTTWWWWQSRSYPTKTIKDADYADDIAVLANTPAQAKTLLHSLEWAAAGIGLHVNAHKIEYMCFNQRGDIPTQNDSSLKLVDKFIYLRSSVSSTVTDISTWLAKAISHMEVRPDW